MLTETARERFSTLLDQVDAAYREMQQLSSDGVGNGYRVVMAERLETQERLNRGLMYRVFGEIADPPDESGMVPEVPMRLSMRLRIPPREVKRRMKWAANICARRQLSGPPLSPLWQAVAAAVASGRIGDDHVAAITKTLKNLPMCTSPADRAEVEASLVREAQRSDADIVTVVGRRIDDLFNPDGHFDETERAQQRGVKLGPQNSNGLSRISGVIDPETRSYIEACAAAVRPGRHCPDGTVEDLPDDRSAAQRCHDGIKLGLKLGIASGGMGSHRGHPVTVIVRTTLAELNQAAHAVSNPNVSMPSPARTGGDTALPMRDLIRMATDAIHYLAVFDGHTDRPLYLGRQTRIATTDQRMICYSRDGGCTRPNCTAPGYHSEVHHSPDWAAGGRTDADALFFACGPDHTLLTRGRMSATARNGRLAWSDGTSPPRINHVHHPDELLRGDPDPPR
ncbi:13E12 repeat family protein [Mycobacterium sp. SMC-4]|uniref:13E12 repeat family protein n=1 Tax=Mycobacterium sp. SMC-4 TaxID=2857059 RepID=UPI0021B27252|nr:13E12 repeat family protein [Mycobacterium sp. SMC-4]UXA17801.1 13E12 repeat family protein [Mycobacterium sp. SMC-4]